MLEPPVIVFVISFRGIFAPLWHVFRFLRPMRGIYTPFSLTFRFSLPMWGIFALLRSPAAISPNQSYS
jgi:hypothetical protein